jgi:hypothetical protein
MVRRYFEPDFGVLATPVQKTASSRPGRDRWLGHVLWQIPKSPAVTEGPKAFARCDLEAGMPSP